jgi:hypothetical protein
MNTFSATLLRRLGSYRTILPQPMFLAIIFQTALTCLKSDVISCRKRLKLCR